MPFKSILFDRNVVNYFVKMQTNSGAPCWVPRHRSDRDAIAFICFECQKAICVHFVSSCCPAALPCEILRIYKCLELGIIICKNAPSSSFGNSPPYVSFGNLFNRKIMMDLKLLRSVQVRSPQL